MIKIIWQNILKTEEVYTQRKAEKVSVEGDKENILKILDWYINENYMVIITEYD